MRCDSSLYLPIASVEKGIAGRNETLTANWLVQLCKNGRATGSAAVLTRAIFCLAFGAILGGSPFLPHQKFNELSNFRPKAMK